MGLIKAAASAIGSTLGDQWEDYISCESLDDNTLIVKKTTKTGQISAKSRIQVSSGQVAIIFDSGKIIDATAEEGIYTFDASSSPSLFAGQFGATFKEAWQRFTYNGQPAKEQAIFYVNVKEILGNKFGSQTPIAYDDPTYRGIYIRYFGSYTFKITNPLVFFQNIAGNVTDTYTKEKLMEQANAEFVTSLDTALGNCAADGIQYNQLSREQSKLAKYMNESLDEEWRQGRGMEVEKVALEKITPDDASRERIEKFDNAAMFGKQEFAAGRMVDATATAMENAASNANGAATGFMGLGMMNMGANQMMGGQSPMAYVQPTPAPTPAPVETPAVAAVDAPVAAVVAPVVTETAPAGITCTNCGTVSAGKFCINCGTGLEAPAPVQEGPKKCANCNVDLADGAKFCIECGTSVI
jgi:Putative virion core protein (lumpy skin disease virus)